MGFLVGPDLLKDLVLQLAKQDFLDWAMATIFVFRLKTERNYGK